jgi:hypothetical protein
MTTRKQLVAKCQSTCEVVGVRLRVEAMHDTKLNVTDAKVKAVLYLIKREICWVYDRFLLKQGVQ